MSRPKKSADYWKWRQARRMYEQMEQADKVGEDISRIYAQASVQLEKEIEKIFFTYQQKWGLSKADAKRLLKKIRGKKTVDVLKTMLPFVDEAVREDFKAQIESGAYAARIKRLEDLQDNLDMVMRDVYKQDEQRQREHYVQHAEDTYNRQIYEIQKEVGFQFEFSEISEEAIDMVLNRKWCGESFSDAIWKNTQGVADSVRDALLIELMTGQRQEDAARAIAERFQVGAMQSRRIVRTESNYISGQVQQQAYEECGADKYMYVATLDSRTDEECGRLDGKVFFVKDQQPGVNMHPMHPNCRCTTVIALDDETLAGLKRRARDPETGESKEVPATMTWEQWKKQADSLTFETDGDILISGGRIVQPESVEATKWAEEYYEEIRQKSTDCEKIAKRLDMPLQDMVAVKEYLFINDSLYNDQLDCWRRFPADASIAQSWQRLAEGKKIEPHDIILIKHELLEMQIKKDNPGISHEKAHRMAESKYNYTVAARKYYDNLREHQKRRKTRTR